MFRLSTGRFGNYCQTCLRNLAQQRLLSHKPSTAVVKFPAFHGNTPLLVRHSPGIVQSRPITSVVGRVAAHFLRIRYLFLTSIVGGGVTLHQKYEDWKDNLPDLSWMRDMMPGPTEWDRMQDRWIRIRSQMYIPQLPELQIRERYERLQDKVSDWFAEVQLEPGLLAEGQLQSSYGTEAGETTVVMPLSAWGTASAASQPSQEERLETLQQEIMNIQMRYQKEVDRLEKENRDLRRNLLMKISTRGRKQRKMKRSLIDMYSDVLDELADYDSSYNTQDHLPRVVVVGDQSSGKTSVLEMIAQARIFPRGSGEMMTRSPVKVTLSEGPYHVAQFKDNSREYDLTKESELEALRREIEIRMKASVANGQTVSGETISLTVKGPGLQRMVLVDLPGIISTVTSGMAVDTREKIQRICKHHMENPNAIILCIQDGSLDAERSNVTDLVNSMDAGGQRTIFVLTKVDLAESNLLNPERIRQILEGKLFPMKALGYFAVVTGKGNTADSISTIKEYEESFFRGSRLFKDGILKPTQMTTANLSMAVSECFWKMVRESVEQQADAFKATRFNLETEWKNTFPRLRELDREELFEKARGEILDEIINLSQITAPQWEDAFNKRLWERMTPQVFENIYIPAAQTDSTGTFNTVVDIKLKQWADKELPRRCVETGRQTLEDAFSQLLLEHTKHSRDAIFDALKQEVMQRGMGKHKWDNKAEDSLRIMQTSVLEDRSVHDKNQWDSAVSFMEDTVKQQLTLHDTQLKKMTGPSSSEQWLYWQSRTDEQKNRVATIRELERLFASDHKLKQNLTEDELTTIRKNLQTKNYDVNNYFIRDTWKLCYRQHFLEKAMRTAHECTKGFYYYQRGFADGGLDCNDVVLFWRIQRMLDVTSKALRQQVMNNESRCLERNMKQVLDEIGEDKETLTRLLTGRRVTLAEELKRVRSIQDLLEEFIKALHAEK